MKLGLPLAALSVFGIALFLALNRTPTAPSPALPKSDSKVILPRLPAHFTKTTHIQTEESQNSSSNHFREYFKAGNSPKLTREQVEPYLQANHHNAESLLAAFMTTGDRAFVRDAMEKFPN